MWGYQGGDESLDDAVAVFLKYRQGERKWARLCVQIPEMVYECGWAVLGRCLSCPTCRQCHSVLNIRDKLELVTSKLDSRRKFISGNSFSNVYYYWPYLLVIGSR